MAHKPNLTGSVGSACVEIAREGLPSNGLRAVAVEHGEETGSSKEQGAGSSLRSMALGVPLCLKGGSLHKCRSLSHMETGGHMHPCTRNRDPVKVKRRTLGPQPWPCPRSVPSWSLALVHETRHWS